MVGITKGGSSPSRLVSGLETIDQFDLLGVDPTGPRLTLTELRSLARRVSMLVHQDHAGQLIRPVPYTSIQANAMRDWLAGHDNNPLTEAARVAHFYTNTAGHRSRWNPSMRVYNVPLDSHDLRLYQPVPGRPVPTEPPTPQTDRRRSHGEPRSDRSYGPRGAQWSGSSASSDVQILGSGVKGTGYSRSGTGHKESTRPRPAGTTGPPPSTKAPPSGGRSGDPVEVSDDDIATPSRPARDRRSSPIPGSTAYWRAITLRTLTALANDSTNLRVVVALVPLAEGGPPVLAVTVGQDRGNRIRYQVQSFGLDGRRVDDAAGRGNSISYAQLRDRGAVFLGRFNGASEQDIRAFASVVPVLANGLATPGARHLLVRRSHSPP